MRTLAHRVFLGALLTLTFTAASARAQAAAATPGVPAKPKKSVYVQDFAGSYAPSSQSRGGPLSRMRSTRAREKASQSASTLTKDIVTEFAAAGFTSTRLEPGKPLPPDGWLVRGAFYATDSGGNIIPSELLGGEQKPNTQVSVSVSNLAKDPNAPFIVFGKAEALKGQGAPVGWNPYVVAAKFVINQVESATDLDKLAREIVGTILQNKTIIEDKALAQQKE